MNALISCLKWACYSVAATVLVAVAIGVVVASMVLFPIIIGVGCIILAIIIGAHLLKLSVEDDRSKNKPPH
jgi:NhaP-type Na+/H+ or K+/H+ antiporter